jgi:hypothetical protein
MATLGKSMRKVIKKLFGDELATLNSNGHERITSMAMNAMARISSRLQFASFP